MHVKSKRGQGGLLSLGPRLGGGSSYTFHAAGGAVPQAPALFVRKGIKLFPSGLYIPDAHLHVRTRSASLRLRFRKTPEKCTHTDKHQSGPILALRGESNRSQSFRPTSYSPSRLRFALRRKLFRVLKVVFVIPKQFPRIHYFLAQPYRL